MDTGLHIEMRVDPQGHTSTRFQTEGIALAEIGPLVDKAIAALRAERSDMPEDHGPTKPPASSKVLADRLRSVFQHMADSSIPHTYHTGAKALVDEVEHALQQLEVPAAMSDLACLEYAVQKVLLECRKANPNHMLIPPDGATVMRWLAAAITEAKGLRK